MFFLTFVTNVKNYGGDLETLIETLAPWIETEGHIGHYRYEEREMPTILFRNEEGVIEWRELTYVADEKPARPCYSWDVSVAANGNQVIEPRSL